MTATARSPKILLLAPHYDDETLFASYSILQYRPHVVTVFGDARSQVDAGVSSDRRRSETQRALNCLGSPAWTVLNCAEGSPDGVASGLAKIRAEREYSMVIMPLTENGGHVEHNLVGGLAFDLWTGQADLVRYSTYTTGAVRSRTGRKVEPEPRWIFQKLAALSCFRSQSLTPSWRHFAEPLDEYLS